MIPWLRPWAEVRELYAKMQRLKERIEREAAAHGINTKVREQKR